MDDLEGLTPTANDFPAMDVNDFHHEVSPSNDPSVEVSPT